VAEKYDLMNDFTSMGVHRVWKDIFVHLLRPGKNMKLIDVAGGTGEEEERLMMEKKIKKRRIEFESMSRKMIFISMNYLLVDNGLGDIAFRFLKHNSSSRDFNRPPIEFPMSLNSSRLPPEGRRVAENEVEAQYQALEDGKDGAKAKVAEESSSSRYLQFWIRIGCK
jgi:hypothetical protein